jgi:hypothetical protein
MPRLSDRAARILALIFFCSTVSLAVTLASWYAFVQKLSLSSVPEPPKISVAAPTVDNAVSPLLVKYDLDLPGRGEIFPALVATSAQEYWPLAILTISNTSREPLLQLVSLEIPGWSQKQEFTLAIGPQETRTIQLNPALLPDAFALEEVQRATMSLRVTDINTGTTYAQNRPVLIHSGSDFYWGKQFANAQIVARWVTPHDPSVLQLVADARKYIPNGRLNGYNSAPNPTALKRQVTGQARAAFEALKQSRLSYVTSIFTFGEQGSGWAQRIRLPRETLSLRSANCIDVSIAFASAMENLGMSPVIVIVPGHAFTGVRLGPNSSEILYLDLTVLPRGTFAQAIARADGYMKETPTEKILTVDVATTRKMGIYPLPSPRATFVTAAEKPQFTAPPSQATPTRVAREGTR